MCLIVVGIEHVRSLFVWVVSGICGHGRENMYTPSLLEFIICIIYTDNSTSIYDVHDLAHSIMYRQRKQEVRSSLEGPRITTGHEARTK